MPTVTLPEQDGNSCAAHCTVVSIVELLDVAYMRSKEYAEGVLWPEIKFRTGGGPVTDMLAQDENSDPRRIVSETELRWGGAVRAALLCDTQQKIVALNYVASDLRLGFDALFEIIAGAGTVAPIALEDGVYYNCSYVMLSGAAASSATFSGMHNILVTRSGGQVWRYNPNESVPAWVRDDNWKILNNQNGGNHSYVFNGVAVATRKK